MSRFVIKQVALTVRTPNYHLMLSPVSASALNEGSSSTSDPSSPDTVRLTENCIRKMKELQSGEEKKLLRLGVNSGGCSGFKYVFDLDCRTTSDDRVFEKDGVKLIVDSFSYKFVRGAMVDYEDTLIRSAFVVAENPSADKKCGCQNSFTVKQ